MTWEDFKIEVRSLLLAYATTDGVQDYIDRFILAGVVDLQRDIPFYRVGHEDTLTENDSVPEGSASRFSMPSGRIESLWLRFNEASSEEDASVLVMDSPDPDMDGVYVWVDGPDRYEHPGGRFWIYYEDSRWKLWDDNPLGPGFVRYFSAATTAQFPWKTDGLFFGGDPSAEGITPYSYSPDIQVELGLSQVGGDEFRSMIGGDTDRKGRVFIDTQRAVFYVTPALNPETVLVMRWTGVKTNFEDDDETKFDLEAAHVVSEFVLSRLTRGVDKDLRQAQSHYEAYVILKRKLFSDFNARSFVQTNSRTVGYRATET